MALGSSKRSHREMVGIIVRSVELETRQLAENINGGHCPAAAMAFEALNLELGKMDAEIRHGGGARFLPRKVLERVGVAQAEANRFRNIFKRTCIIGRR